MYMKNTMVLLTAVWMGFLLCGSVLAEKGPITTMTTGCQTELDTYCKNVTLGEARLLACLYAHNDKLSGDCEDGLYDALAQLEQTVAALSYVANECKDDLTNYCSGIVMNAGRLIKCLEKNDDKVSDRCKKAREEAREDVGIK